ncbi:MAG TPA: recombinase family protein [Planctomycetota bacterium]|nr:recombinase family protein [Planctomycetota bacterium]
MTAVAVARAIRVAVYTRKSVTDGLDQAFNSLDAQRAAIEAYVQSQAGNGWTMIGKSYDDGGFSGASLERPAFQELLRDIDQGLVDVVVVHRIDRLSRSLRDFAKLLDLFERRGVTFASVTQSFSTANSMGRLLLNVLMSFAEYEREAIADRVRDKIRATRARGAYTGGRVVLGYDTEQKKLVANADEAAQVRAILQLYLEHGCLRATVAELSRRGWRNKSITTRTGKRIEGQRFTKATLSALLRNPIYTGRIRCGTDVVPGAHDAIVEMSLWDSVQQRLRENANGSAKARNKTGALLRGIVRCGRCGSPMLHVFTTRGNKRYGYYCCGRLHNEGPAACPDARVPAGKFEAFIVEQVRCIGTDERLLARTAEAVERRAEDLRLQLDAELRRGERERQRLDAEVQRSADVHADVHALVERLAEVRAERESLDLATEPNLRAALASFTPVWDALFPAARERVLRLLIAGITFNPDTRETDIELQPAGIAALADEARTTP